MDSTKENVIVIEGEKHFPIIKKGDHCHICSLHSKCYDSLKSEELCSIFDKNAHFVTEEDFKKINK